MIAVFDTNIVIDALNGIAEADTEYRLYDRVLISRITWMEVLVGAIRDESRIRDFLETSFEVVDVDLVIAETSVQIRRKEKIRLPDAIILATARIRSARLVTRNTKDFNPEWEDIRVPYMLGS